MCRYRFHPIFRSFTLQYLIDNATLCGTVHCTKPHAMKRQICPIFRYYHLCPLTPRGELPLSPNTVCVFIWFGRFCDRVNSKTPPSWLTGVFIFILQDGFAEEAEEEEEELEWISNKDAFPAVETFILSEQPGGIVIAKQQSPVSVLENSTNSSASLMNSCGALKPPHRARSKGRRRRSEIPAQQLFWNQPNDSKPSSKTGSASKLDIGRKCLHCGSDQTPQWRAGPLGPKTLCNACGVRYKSGRLCPEYRPASSPTFSSEMHSNSHRKVLEMRKQKYGMGMVVKPEDKG